MVLLLSAWTADGLQNISEAAVTSSPQVNNKHITAKEGSSKLIRCNLTGGHDGVEWYNSQGRLQGEEDMLAGEIMNQSNLQFMAVVVWVLCWFR